MAFRRDYSEYHTGYRAFAVDFLRSIAFLRNYDGFVFDQEIFAQIVAARRTRGRAARFRRATSSRPPRSRSAPASEYGLRTLGVLARFRLDKRSRWPLLRPPAARLAPTQQSRTQDTAPAR